MKVTARERVYAWDHDTGGNLEKVRFIQRRKVDANQAKRHARRLSIPKHPVKMASRSIIPCTFKLSAGVHPKQIRKQVSKVYMYQSAHASTAVDTVKHNRYSNQNDHNGIAVYPRRLTAKRKQK